MHELSLAVATLELLEQQASTHGLKRVERVVMRIGQLAGVELPALQLALEEVLADTIAAGAELIYEEEVAWAQCPHCATQFQLEQLYDACPACGFAPARVLSGRDLRLQRFEGV